MKILHVIDACSEMYGAECMLLNLMEEQLKIGITPIMLSLSGLEERIKSLEYEAEKRKIYVKKIRMSKRFSWKDARKIIGYAHSSSIDLIHSHSYKSDILLGSLPKKNIKVPIITTVHGWTSVKKFRKMWFYMVLAKLSHFRMNAIVRVNNVKDSGLLSWFLNKYKKNSFIVENGIPLLPFENELDEFQNDKILKFCKGYFCICAIGRLSEEKGFNYLIGAIELLVKSGHNFKAVIIGEGSLEPELKKIIKEKKLSAHVLLVGYRENASRYLKFFNVMVLPSLTEGLPITLLEAMQAKCPIVATCVGGVPKALDNGKCGMIVAPRSSHDIAQKIIFLKEHPDIVKKIIQCAYEFVTKRYSIQRMASEYLSVYNNIISDEAGVEISNHY
jgi:glycosyltransferase involved in cell wall biosynthesis